MAAKYNAKDIQEVVCAFSSMLRFSLNNGENFISIWNEVEQVKSYIKIQQIRSKDLFDTEIYIDERIIDYNIIKLLLQPLVENAILHGFKKIDYKGTLKLSAKSIATTS